MHAAGRREETGKVGTRRDPGSNHAVPWFSYSTNAFLRFSTPAALSKIADLGFDGAEILVDRPHVWPYDEVTVAAAAASIKRTGLRISNVNINTAMGLDGGICRDGPGPSLSDADPARVGARMRYCQAALRAAWAIGASTASVTTGPARRGAWKDAMDSLAVLADLAAAVGIRLGIEYEPGFLIGDVKTLRKAWKDVKHPTLGANLDLGHARVVGEDVTKSIELCAGRTWNVHVEDIKGRKHYHLPVGDGDMPWPKIAKSLRETGYDGPLTLELYTCDKKPVEAGKKSLKKLREIFAEAGAGAVARR